MLDESYSTIRHFYERTFWEAPGAVTEYGAGYVLSYAGSSWLTGANQLWLDDEASFGIRLIEKSVVFFRQHLAEWSIFVLPDLHPNLKERCLRSGGYIRWSNPIMLLEGLPKLSFDVSSVQVVKVSDERQRNFARSIMREAFNMDPRVSRNTIRPDHNDGTLHHYLAYHRGHPAAVGTLNYTPSMAGIWNIGTRRMFRRRGMAHALVLRMCQDALRNGYRFTMLMASPPAGAMYERMGYRTLAQAHYMALALY